MTQRIPAGMPIHNWVDRLIAEAQERGEFDNLPGAGKPLAGLDQPLDEDWWLRQKIRDDELPSDALLPPALQLRKEVRALPQTVRDLPDEATVRAMVSEVNQRVADWIRAPSGPVLPIAPARADDVVASWRAARSEARPASPRSPAPAGGPTPPGTPAPAGDPAAGQSPGDAGAIGDSQVAGTTRRFPGWRRMWRRHREPE